jgi:hypothetical protein
MMLRVAPGPPTRLQCQTMPACESVNAKKNKSQAEALSKISDLIEGFQLLDHRHGRIAYGKTDAAKSNARAHVAKAQAKGHDMVVVAQEVEKFFREMYEADERSRECV